VKPTRQRTMFNDPFAFAYGTTEIEIFPRQCKKNTAFPVVCSDIAVPNDAKSVIK
jgi:hypothetical protein